MLLFVFLLASFQMIALNAMENIRDDNSKESTWAISSNAETPTQILLHKLSQRDETLEVQEFQKLLEDGADLFCIDENTPDESKTDKHNYTALHYIVFKCGSTGKMDLIELCCEMDVDWDHTTQPNMDSAYKMASQATKFERANGLKNTRKVFEKIDAHQKKRQSSQNQ